MADISSFESLIARANNYQGKFYEVWSHFVVSIKKEIGSRFIFFYYIILFVLTTFMCPHLFYYLFLSDLLGDFVFCLLCLLHYVLYI